MEAKAAACLWRLSSGYHTSETGTVLGLTGALANFSVLVILKLAYQVSACVLWTGTAIVGCRVAVPKDVFNKVPWPGAGPSAHQHRVAVLCSELASHLDHSLMDLAFIPLSCTGFNVLKLSFPWLFLRVAARTTSFLLVSGSPRVAFTGCTLCSHILPSLDESLFSSVLCGLWFYIASSYPALAAPVPLPASQVFICLLYPYTKAFPWLSCYFCLCLFWYCCN